MHNGDVSYWWNAIGLPTQRPALTGPTEADVCVIGGGYTGLWTAYYLRQADPSLRVVVLESEFAGFGASGRNGGWVTAALTGSRSVYERHGDVDALEAALRETVDEVGRVCEAEGIQADYVKGGSLSVAMSATQEARLRASSPGQTWLTPEELSSRLRVAGAHGAMFTPHCARVQPAALVSGLASAVSRLGVTIYEGSRVVSVSPGVARTAFGEVRARYILRCTEGFTADFPGQHRTLLPMNSAMIVTEPLPPSAWDTIGWSGAETLGDEAHAYMYAQRTADGRIALGGRGIPYRFGSGIDSRGAVAPSTVSELHAVLTRMFPAAADAGIAHAWCGVLGVPRDWCASVSFNSSTGLGWAGGYAGHGVAAANLAGRTLADLARGVSSPLVSLPWVNHRSREWEPEPFRWAGVHSLYAVYRLADRLESDGQPSARVAAGKALGRAGDLISGIPHLRFDGLCRPGSGPQPHRCPIDGVIPPSMAHRWALNANGQ
ncbi:MAG: FAD-dependent oxidoreductase [Streptosporangiaceae bacterium]